MVVVAAGLAELCVVDVTGVVEVSAEDSDVVVFSSLSVVEQSP